MEMINIPDEIKEKHLNTHSLVTVKLSAVKFASNMFGVSKQYIIIELKIKIQQIDDRY